MVRITLTYRITDQGHTLGITKVTAFITVDGSEGAGKQGKGS